LRKLLLLLIPVVLLLGWLFARGSGPAETPFTRVVRETIVSTLNTNGKVEPIEWAAAHAEVGGPIERVDVQRGQTVHKGQLLITIAVPDAQTQLSTSQARIEAARAEIETLNRGGRASELAEIESGLIRGRSELTSAQTEYATLQRLAAKNAATKADVEVARRAVERAEQQIQSLERRRSSLVTQPDLAAAQARLNEAQVAATGASQRIARGQVQSPMTGILYRLEARPGGYVNPGDLVAEVGRLNQLRVRVYVDEPDLGRVQKGMPVTITWDAMQGRQWKGFVESVPLQVVALGTRQVGEVVCTIDNPDLTLIPGTNVNAEIRSKVAANTLTVPKEVIRRQGSDTGVFTLDGNKLAWRPVRVGVSSVTRVQIVEGLKEGDPVALPVEKAIKSGDEVKPVFQ
jgi:HlyD family secretion protein